MIGIISGEGSLPKVLINNFYKRGGVAIISGYDFANIFLLEFYYNFKKLDL